MERLGRHEATPATSKAAIEAGKGNSAGAEAARFGRDFSKISIAAPDRAAGKAAGDSGSGIRSSAGRHRYALPVTIRRVRPASQNDSMSGDERKPAIDFATLPSQTPVTPAGTSAAAPREGATVTFSQIPAIELSSLSDSIASALTYAPAINPISPPAAPTKFGQADAKIEVNRSSGNQANGAFTVDFVVDNIITYWVAGGTRTDIASDSAPAITQSNYSRVASDLTPSPTAVNAGGVQLLKNQSPRGLYWARDLTIKHELFHADEDEKFGREGATEARDWLNRQTAATFDQVAVLLGRASQIVANKILREMVEPAVEQRAYDHGAAEYRARAQAIKAKGDARGYVRQPPAPSSPPASPPAPAPNTSPPPPAPAR